MDANPFTTGYLSDGKKKSHTRLMVMICVPALVLVPLLISAWLAIITKTSQHIDPSVPLYIGVANGIILGYAAHNKRQESKDSKSQEAAP